jgi:hypothetical protein
VLPVADNATVDDSAAVPLWKRTVVGLAANTSPELTTNVTASEREGFDEPVPVSDTGSVAVYVPGDKLPGLALSVTLVPVAVRLPYNDDEVNHATLPLLAL